MDKSEITELIESGMKCAQFCALKLTNTCISFEELYEIALVELVECAHRYKRHGETKFTTYAEKCISGKLLTYLKCSKKNRDELILNNKMSIDDEANEFIDFIVDEKSDFTEEIENKYSEPFIFAFAKTNLSHREFQIIKMFFGIDCYPMLKFKIAKTLNLTPHYVGEVITIALKKLHKILCPNEKFKPIGREIKLTKKQSLILEMSNTLSVPQIADKLCLHPSTVQEHLSKAKKNYSKGII